MPNLLATSASPYLRQHADNPVEWMPWGEPAFERARREGKPLFVSIGYATCHWCHVMAHESFEDPGVAALINASFIPVKVDREERPDVDKVYMTYVQSVSGRGGWPLNVFLTPDLKPFFGGTYFPVEDLQGRPGFASLLGAITQAWETQRTQLEEEGTRVVESLAEHFSTRAPDGEGEGEAGAWLEEAWPAVYRYFNDNFDAEHGGFGGAPKFPQPGNLAFLLRYAAATQDGEGSSQALHMVSSTLAAMARGGVHDHVGGGFHRYSVDEAWFVPHFEKMLYDQAQIASVAVEAWRATGDGRFSWLARDILGYVLRDLAHPEGGYYSAEDADSPVSRFPGAVSREGAFYLWGHGELRETLGEDAAFVALHFGVQETGNVPAQLDPHGEMRGGNILAQTGSLAETAARAGIPPAAASALLARALESLRLKRSGRARPLRDGKLLTAWNGLMLSALCAAANAPAPALREGWERGGRQALLAEATRTAEYLYQHFWDEGTAELLRSRCEGVPGPLAVAEDYACLIAGLLDLYEAGFDTRWLRWALRLQERMDELFLDGEGGGYFNSRAGAADLVLRLKEDYDGAEPAPSSVAVSNLLRLAALLERPGFRAQALATVAGFRARWSRTPQAMPVLIGALERCLMWPPLEVLITGRADSEAVAALLDVLWERPGQPRVLLALDPRCDLELLFAARPELRLLDLSQPTVRLCVNGACQAPVGDPEALRQQLAGL